MIRLLLKIALISLILLVSTAGEAWTENGIIRVSPDGSLIIIEKTGVSLKLPSEKGNEVDSVGFPSCQSR